MTVHGPKYRNCQTSPRHRELSLRRLSLQWLASTPPWPLPSRTPSYHSAAHHRYLYPHVPISDTYGSRRNIRSTKCRYRKSISGSHSQQPLFLRPLSPPPLHNPSPLWSSPSFTFLLSTLSTLSSLVVSPLRYRFRPPPSASRNFIRLSSRRFSRLFLACVAPRGIFQRAAPLLRASRILFSRPFAPFLSPPLPPPRPFARRSRRVLGRDSLLSTNVIDPAFDNDERYRRDTRTVAGRSSLKYYN